MSIDNLIFRIRVMRAYSQSIRQIHDQIVYGCQVSEEDFFLAYKAAELLGELS